MRTLRNVALLASLVAAPLALAQPEGAKDLEHVIVQPPKVYDETADARQQIAAALATAKLENRRVLIQWGGNWCPWCVKLHDTFKADKDIARTLMYEYDVVYVDAGRPPGKNLDLAESFGADINGFPYLTILDADGKAIANQDTGSLEVKDNDGESVGVSAGHDQKAVLKFLKDHQAPYLNASEILDKGLAEAKATNRRVFLHFGAPWCPYCHMLDNWMRSPGIATILTKEFVDVKIDTDRTIGGGEILAKHNPSKMSGIPWFAFLDAGGQTIATSTMDDGENTGFPIAPQEIDHFEKMLKNAKNLTAAELATLIQSLRENAEEQGH